MAALSDIPPNLLSPLHQLDFLHWLLSVPLDVPASRALLRIWAEYTGRPFTSEQFDYIIRSRRRGNGH